MRQSLRRILILTTVSGTLAPAVLLAATAPRFSWRAYADPYEGSYQQPLHDARFPAQPFGRPVHIDQALLMVLGRQLFEELLFRNLPLTPEQQQAFAERLAAAGIEPGDLSASDQRALGEGRLNLGLLERLAQNGAERFEQDTEFEEAGGFGGLINQGNIAIGIGFTVEAILQSLPPDRQEVLRTLINDPDTGLEVDFALVIAFNLRNVLAESEDG